MGQWLDRYFHLTAQNTTVKTEVMAGITTFITMAYILIVNPAILSATGMDFGAIFTATVLSAIIATLIMALWANLPLALASGMGLNTLFAYDVVQNMGYSWSFALTATLLVGLLFLLMSLFHIRETVVKHMPRSLQNAISAGIGLFIASIGLKNAGIIVANDTSLIALGNLSAPAPLLACFGLCITSILLVRKVPMALLFGIAITTILGFFVGVTKMPTAIFSAPPSLTPTFLHFDFSHLFSWDMLFVVFAFAMVGIFNTAGTLIGFATKSGWMDENNELPVAKKALLSDAVGTTVGACLGTSTLTIFAESASGIAAGGKTGLTALTAALCLILAVFLSPLILIVPNAATGPALVLVGVFMASPLANIDFVDYSEGIPAFLTAVMMPFTSSLADGIGIGVIAYCILKLTGGPKLRQDLNPMILTFALLFVLKYLFL